MRAARKGWMGSIAVLVALHASRPARADEAKLVLMREPTSYTDVIDAADRDDKFDANVHLGYQRVVDRGTIRRETTADGERRRAALAHSERVVSQLQLGADVGLYKDVMAFVRLPLILRDTRALSLAEGVSASEAAGLLQDPLSSDGSASFQLPQRAPARAGFDYLAFGGAAAITSQERKSWLPTWTVWLEGRRAVGRLQRPCRVEQDESLCRSVDGSDEMPGATSKKSASGVSRGVSALSIETRVSKRFRYVEPYAGLAALIEWASTAKQAFRGEGGFKETAPSRQFTATLGSEWIAWEHRGRYQRIAVDARLFGTYFTAGRDYSALYDALGSTSQLGPSAGLTKLGERMRVGARLGAEVRAARYVRFSFGAGLSSYSSYQLSVASPCARTAASDTGSASCTGYRASIDAPGRRFWMTGELLYEFYAAATAQF